ncbi:phage major tail tube protein [Neisseria shayeganii]|uniref:Phage tail core protein n=1 Tax=Neisseria shayeganii 871 TaxID=1032488 RepID=G4CJF7_9NEIS|nr:phage major tail tube protein [Neisseria shayeganii]EGY52008.1 phage tail core protein [Neisseria shayeganii 871]
MSVELNVIYNANLYLNGNTQIGRANEVKLPEIEILQDEHAGLGLAFDINLPKGFKVGEGEISWNSLYADAFNGVYLPFKAQQLMVRGNLQTHNGEGLVKEEPVVVVLTVKFSKVPLGGYKPKERAEWPSTFTCTAGSVKAGGRELLYFDAFANKYRVNGQDQLAQMRRNIGQ